MHIVNNRLFAPFFIFVKDKSKLSEDQLLEKLDLTHYKHIKQEEDREVTSKRYLYIADDGIWKHLMDDYTYGLWMEDKIEARIKNLSNEYDVYCCSIGDVDDSFDFTYYRDGVEIRDYKVDDHNFDGGKVVKNFGEAFEFEVEALSKEDVLDKVLAIAHSLGININHEVDKIRCYGKDSKLGIEKHK